MVNYFEIPGDKELWVLRDLDGQLPVFVQQGRMVRDQTEAWKISPATTMEPDQREWLARHLDELSFKREPGWWLVRPKRAQARMQKAPGITPSFYIHWGNLSARRDPQHLGGETHDEIEANMTTAANAFVKYAANKMGIDDLKFARLMWYNFCQCAVNWMTVEQFPLDMLFAKMRAFPYRANWEPIIAAKFPGFVDLCRLPPEERKKRIGETSLKTHLEMPEMAAMHTATLFDWTVSVELRDIFFDTTRRNEQKEYDRLGPARYYERWLRVVGSLWVGAVETLASYFVQAGWPVGDVDRCLPAHSRFLRRLLSKGRVRPAAPDVPPVDYIIGDGPPDRDIRRKGRPDDPEAFAVQEVPDADIVLDMRPGG